MPCPYISFELDTGEALILNLFVSDVLWDAGSSLPSVEKPNPLDRDGFTGGPENRGAWWQLFPEMPWRPWVATVVFRGLSWPFLDHMTR